MFIMFSSSICQQQLQSRGALSRTAVHLHVAAHSMKQEGQEGH